MINFSYSRQKIFLSLFIYPYVCQDCGTSLDSEIVEMESTDQCKTFVYLTENYNGAKRNLPWTI